MTATIEAIRDRVLTLIEGITPAQLTGNRFRRSLDEGAANLIEWAEENPQAAFRRFQVRDDGDDPGVTETSSMNVELRRATLIIGVAYPHDKRAGSGGGRDRDDCMDRDWRKIYNAIGPGNGQGSYSGANDCTVMSCSKYIDRGQACDFLIVTLVVTYYLDVTA